MLGGCAKTLFIMKENVKYLKMLFFVDKNRSKSVHIFFIYAYYTPLGNLLKKTNIFTKNSQQRHFWIFFIHNGAPL